MKRFAKSILRAVAIDGGVGLENPTRLVNLLEEFSDKTHQLQIIQYTSGGMIGAAILAVLSGGSVGVLGASIALIAGALGATLRHGLSGADSRELALLDKHRSLLQALSEIDRTYGSEKTLSRYEELIAAYSPFEDCFYWGQVRISGADITSVIEQAIASNATSIPAALPTTAPQASPANQTTRFSLAEFARSTPLNSSLVLPTATTASQDRAAQAEVGEGQPSVLQWDADVPLNEVPSDQSRVPPQIWDADVQPDDLPILRKSLRHPAVLIFGESGAGKSTLAEWDMAERTKEGHQVEVWDPHAAYGQWDGLPVYGQGLDYAGCDRRIVAFINLVKSRYLQRSQNPNFNPRPLSVLVEEFTKWDGKCPHAGELLAIALSDVRKINVFILFVAHDRTLTSLGGAKGVAAARDKGLMEIELDAVQDPTTDALVSAQTGRIYYPGRKSAPVEISLPNLRSDAAPAAPAAAVDVRYQLEWLLERSVPTGSTSSSSALPQDAEALYRWAARQGKPVRERQVLAAKLKGLEGYSADQIRELFRLLELQGYGTTKPAGSGLEFDAG